MLLRTRITSQNAARIVPKDIGGTPQVPIRYVTFETTTGSTVTESEFTNSTTAFVGADYFNAPVFASTSGGFALAGIASSGLAVVQLDQYNYLRFAPLLRHASAVSNATCTLHKWLLWMGTHKHQSFIRGEYRGSYSLVAGSKLLVAGDPMFSATAQTAHCDTITAATDAAPIDDPVITGGATAAQQRLSVTCDQEGAFAVAFQAVNGSGVSTAIELSHM